MSDEMTQERQPMPAPDMGTGAVQTPSDVEAGLGTSRYKEYDIPGYAQIVRAHVPAEIWSGVYYSWLSLKGHVQALHDFDRTEFFATGDHGGDVEVLFAVIWKEAEALADWIEHGYAVDMMLERMGISGERVDVQLMRDFS